MKAKSRSLLPLLLLAALVFTSCQLPLTGDQTGRIEVRNPYLQGAQRKSAEPLVAFPQNVLASLDHYVLKVLTTAGDPIPGIPDQILAPASPVFAVDMVAVGNYKLVVEAWSTVAIKTAESSQIISVTAGAVTTIDTLVLKPLASGGAGTFNFTLTIATGFGGLATAGKLSASLSQLNYTSGSLDGVPTPLAKSLFTFTPSASSLGFATTSTLAAGNYLITLERASSSLVAPSPIPVASILVQVFPGQESTIGTAAIPDGWLDTPPVAPPIGVRAEMDHLGDIYVAWDAPLLHQTTSFYQIGYALDEAATVPEAQLVLASGNGDFLAGAPLERLGNRLRVKVATNTPPFNSGEAQVALFVRSVAGTAAPSAWTIYVFDPTEPLRPRPIPALVFWDLKPGARYELQKRSSTADVLASFEFSAAAWDPTADSPPQTFTFPGLSVAPGESLVLTLHQPDGTFVETPLALDAVNTLDYLMTYDPTAPYYVHPATRDPEGSPSDEWILLEDPDYAALGATALDPAPTVSLTTPEGNTIVGWSGTALGGDHLTRTGWTLETDSSTRPEKLILAAGDTEYTTFTDWAPQDGKVTRYRARAVYQYTFNTVLFEILGPPSAWAGWDLQPPAIVVESWGNFASPGDLSAVFRYTDFQTANDTPSALTVSLWEWGGGLVKSSTDTFVTTNGVTTWSPPIDWLGEGDITVNSGASYQLRITATDASGNETSVGTALKGGQ